MDHQTSPADFQFEVGQVIHHKRYGYRGVVFERDPGCTADEEWYQRNQTQPPRDQPWYRVLVHGAAHTTYVAESNLEPDPSDQPVEHPLLGRLFASRARDRYYPESLN